MLQDMCRAASQLCSYQEILTILVSLDGEGLYRLLRRPPYVTLTALPGEKWDHVTVCLSLQRLDSK